MNDVSVNKVLLSALPALALLLPTVAAADRIYTDAQLHYVNFVQETDGMKALFRAMDEANIHDVAIMGLGVIKKWEESAPKEPR